MKRAVLVICDGLRADMLHPERTPNICRLVRNSTNFVNHRGVFPSTTRTTSASIATGCYPGRHGLEGNAVALDEGDGLVPLSVGASDFRDRLRNATGQTLRVPTLAERLKGSGGSIVFSNVSPGAAYFQDPDNYGYVYHRAGSFGPGGVPVSEGDGLNVTHDAEGDAAMTTRFCQEVIIERKPALAVLWQCEPDHSQHSHVLGSPTHLDAIAAADANADRVAATVEKLNAEDDNTLLLIGSDHGHETVDKVVDLDEALISAGLKDGTDSNDVVITSQGLSAFVYLSKDKQNKIPEIATFLSSVDGVGKIYAGAELERIGQNSNGALAIAVDAMKSETKNEYGIPGHSVAFANRFSMTLETGKGEHGGFGKYEQNPFLIAIGGGFAPGTTVTAKSSAIDIAPTILRHLGLPENELDGKALPQ